MNDISGQKLLASNREYLSHARLIWFKKKLLFQYVIVIYHAGQKKTKSLLTIKLPVTDKTDCFSLHLFSPVLV